MDYESRIKLNCTLDPVDRKVNKLGAEECIGHDLFIRKQILHNRLTSFGKIPFYRTIKRFNHMCAIFELFKDDRYFDLIRRFHKVRLVFIQKMLENVDNDDLNIPNIGSKRKLKIKNIALDLLMKVDQLQSYDVNEINPTPISIIYNDL